MQISIPEQTARQAEELANRLTKRYKHLKKWAKRTNVSCFRLYDKDIPEIPLAVDLYNDITDTELPYLHIALYERPYEKPQEEEEKWLDAMKKAASNALNVPQERIFVKFRQKQRGENAQYEKVSKKNTCITVQEQGISFKVNLSDYLDTGLFFDHRPLRNDVRQEASDKHVLNLFCYTGSFSCYAALGGAASVDSVDLSTTYLQWTQTNFALNNINTTQKVPSLQQNGRLIEKYRFIQEDAVIFTRAAAVSKPETTLRSRWDIIILDPPTFSNSKRMNDIFDINNSWADIVNTCLSLLNTNGVLYFSTNSHKLKFNEALVHGKATDITEATIPEDFRSKTIHRCWRIRK